MDLQCERFKSASSKAGAETNLVFIISQAVWCSFVEVRAEDVLLKPEFEILIRQNPAFPRSPSALRVLGVPKLAVDYFLSGRG